MRKPEIKHFGIIRNGIKIYYNKELYEKQITGLEGKEFEEIIKEKSKKTSSSTHGYYRGGILPSLEESTVFSGWERNEIHEYFQSRFLMETYDRIVNGERKEITTIRSTADLNQSEMNHFIEQVIKECAELGIEILPPEQYNLTKYRIIKDEHNNKRPGNS